MNVQPHAVIYPKSQPSLAMSVMDNDLTKNTLIGLTTSDTLANVSDIIMLLKNMEFSGSIHENSEYGLQTLYTLIRNSLEYEIERLQTPVT